MTAGLVTFLTVVVALTVLQTATASRLSGAKTVYEMTDRPSWIIGGVLAVAIGLWRPWFTESWWKALIVGPLLVISMASTAQTFLGRSLSFDKTKATPYLRVARVVSSLLVLLIMFLGFRACG